jgi:hypothetical protein
LGFSSFLVHGVISGRSDKSCTLETKDNLAPVFLYIHMHTSVCVCVCVCVCTHRRAHTHTHTHTYICQMEFNPYWLRSSWIRFTLCCLPSHVQQLTDIHNSRHYRPAKFKSSHPCVHFSLFYTITSVVVKVKVCVSVPIMKAQW